MNLTVLGPGMQDDLSGERTARGDEISRFGC